MESMFDIPHTTQPNDRAFPYQESLGITKREYFAAIALQGILASGSNIEDPAAEAVHLADWLIDTLSKTK